MLGQRNVYLLPTGAGWMLALVLLVLLVTSINFQLNLGYLTTFVLASSASASVWLGHATLRGLALRLAPPEPVCVGDSAALVLQLGNARASARRAIAAALHAGGPWCWCDVPARGTASVSLAFSPAQRGLQPLPLLLLRTLYPLGIFRIWALWQPAAQILVYPRPETSAPALPAGPPLPGDASSSSGRDALEYEGVRAWRRGDPLRLVAWKKAARTLASGSGELVSRDSAQTRQQQLWLDYAATGLAEREARLSRLAAWVLQADRLGLAYGLRLPGRELAQASGAAQRLRCLEALALYQD